MPLIEVTNLARALRDMKDAGVWLTGLAGEAETSLYDVDLKGKAALVMGGEGEGMRPYFRRKNRRMKKPRTSAVVRNVPKAPPARSSSR